MTTMRRWMAPLAAGLLATAALDMAAAAKPALPTTWDGMVLAPSKRLAAVYLLPGADFRPYTKVMFDPAQVAFKKNWVRDYNTDRVGTAGRLGSADADRIAKQARDGFDEILTKAFADAGYKVVTSPGPDVMRLTPGVINVAVAAPDLMTPGMGRTWTVDAGEATVILEARDSATGALLGRAVDRRKAGDRTAIARSSVTNRDDFARLFRDWAKAAVDGLAQLKALSPIDPSGQMKK